MKDNNRRMLSRNFIIATVLLAVSVLGCTKDHVDHPIIGEWNMNSVTIGIYHGNVVGLEVIESFPVDEGGMEFKSNYRGAFLGEDYPDWMPTKFDWRTKDDTLFLGFFGYEINTLFSYHGQDAVEFLDMILPTDSVGSISEQDTVMQIRLQR